MTTTNTLPANSGKVRLITLWILSGLVALAFLAGAAGYGRTVRQGRPRSVVPVFHWSSGGRRRHRSADSTLRVLCSRPAWRRHGWCDHRACDRTRHLPRCPSCAARPQRDDRLVTEALIIKRFSDRRAGSTRVARAERLIRMENQMRNQSEPRSLAAVKTPISREA